MNWYQNTNHNPPKDKSLNIIRLQLHSLILKKIKNMFAYSFKHYNTIRLTTTIIIFKLLGHKVRNMAKNTCKSTSRVDNYFCPRRPKHYSLPLHITTTI
jgi:hypothetical protein